MRIFHLLLILTFIEVNTSYSQENNYWPKTFSVDSYQITIFTPTPEKFENQELDARAAFSLMTNSGSYFFGALWFHCKVIAKAEANQVVFRDVEVINADFPDATSEEKAKLKLLIQAEAVNWEFNHNLREFYSRVSEIQINNTAGEELKNHPPRIFYSPKPSTLVFIDGEPIMENVDGSELYQMVVNTPLFIVLSKSNNIYYLNSSNYWFETSDLFSGWRAIEMPPQQILKLSEAASRMNSGASTMDGNAISHPMLFVSNEPAALISTQGEPEIKLISGDLFVVTNTDNDLLFHAGKDAYYVLISGRWYTGKKLNGTTWTFVEPNELPLDFMAIPSGSAYAHLKLSVTGSPEAIAAGLNNAIPQTAVIDREKATMHAAFDGEPVFEAIPGTGLEFAVNTYSCIIRQNNEYFGLDEAVWFKAENPAGPWKVSDVVPGEINRIPPSCPVFNSKFVRVYASDASSVLVGYTPGYGGAFLYKGVVFYGTGYRYKSWYGKKYIARPVTFGQAAPKAKKGPSISVYAYSGGGPGFYGPYGYYGGGWSQYAYNQNYYQGQTLTIDHNLPTERAIDLENIYKNRQSGVLFTETIRRNDPLKPVPVATIPSDTPQLYVDKAGKLYQYDADGRWQVRKDGRWIPAEKQMN